MFLIERVNRFGDLRNIVFCDTLSDVFLHNKPSSSAFRAQKQNRPAYVQVLEEFCWIKTGAGIFVDHQQEHTGFRHFPNPLAVWNPLMKLDDVAQAQGINLVVEKAVHATVKTNLKG